MRDKTVKANTKISATCDRHVTELLSGWKHYLPSFGDNKTPEKEPDISEIDEDTKAPTEGVEAIQPSKMH